ncbi:MAG TPA: hypothetical protein VI756_14700, partial [Blastocatellia bacterium]
MYKARIIIILSACFFAVQFLYAGSGIYDSFSAGLPRSDTGWFATDSDNLVFITGLSQDRLPLEINDQIVSVNGKKIRKASDAFAALHQLPPGTPYLLGIKRGGNFVQFALYTQPVPLIRVALLRLALAIIFAVFLITGFTVFVLKPYDKQALLLALMFGMFTGLVPPLVGPGWLLPVVAFSRICSMLALPVFFHFFLVFPEQSPLLRRFPRLEFYLYLPFLLTFFPYWTVAVVWSLVPNHSTAVLARLGVLGRIGAPLLVVYLAGGLLSLLLNYRQAGAYSKRRMRILVAGSLVGFVPGLVLIGVLDVFGYHKINPTVIQWTVLILLFTFPLFPLSFAYAIVRHQVIPVRLMLRRGVRYVFVSQGSIVLEMAAVFLSLAFVLYALFTYLNTTNGLIIGVISGVVSVGVWELTGYLHQRIIAPAIDRRFFRQAYNAQQILSEVGSALRYMTDVRDITSLASTKIQDALHTENVVVFLPDVRSGDYKGEIDARPDEAAADEPVAAGHEPGRRAIGGEGVGPLTLIGLTLPASGYVVQKLRVSAAPLIVDFDDPKSWLARIAATAWPDPSFHSERRALHNAGSALLLPISTKE